MKSEPGQATSIECRLAGLDKYYAGILTGAPIDLAALQRYSGLALVGPGDWSGRR